ncbi:anti-sigma factor family protein [Ferdinandcohnia quinoae]|uniref:Zinc-finger domain-containing protein n=1 Tax=Fredinandcohnia quinoae TaxID=2918902 RepID=A0AAW5E3I7_9BACI|nr:hypothetical protein [Fredinandcohnia sp. SECRCQ15]MCH1624657.1 hypothetical protein [Fredinandcohnia sp. SECRCQ15]
MKHFSEDDWLTYIKDELSESKREELEDHLFSCDQCMDVYIKLIDTQAEQLPDLDDSSFTDEVMAKLPQKKARKRTVYQHPLFHYGVAAIITITLMTTGVFQSITGIVATVEASSSMSKQEQTLSNSLMEKALSIFDKIEPRQKGGKE